MIEASIKDIEKKALNEALKAGSLEILLGPFSARIQGTDSSLVEFLYDAYRDVGARTELCDVTDIALKIGPPSWIRKYIRPQVICDPGFQVPVLPLPSHMSALALEMGMNLGVALKCCRYVTFHAGAVANEKGGILISADSGGGKSTLTASLMEEGYRLLSDEFGLLNMDDASLVAYPRPVSLKNQSIEIVRELSGSDWISSVLEGTPKGRIAYRRVRPGDIEGANKPATPRLILFPNYHPEGEHYARAVPSSEAMMRMIPSSINYHLLGERAYSALVRLMDTATAYEIGYKSTEQAHIIVSDLAEKHGL